MTLADRLAVGCSDDDRFVMSWREELLLRGCADIVLRAVGEACYQTPEQGGASWAILVALDPAHLPRAHLVSRTARTPNTGCSPSVTSPRADSRHEPSPNRGK